MSCLNLDRVFQVAPITIHPAHEKAAHYFGFTIRHVPVGEDFRPDMRAYEQVIWDISSTWE